MSGIQRYGDPAVDYELPARGDGFVVLYADHEAALAEARADERQRIANWREELAEAKAMLATRDEAWYAGVRKCVAVVEREPWRQLVSNQDGIGGIVMGLSVSRPETFRHLIDRDTLLTALRALLPEDQA